MSKVPQFPEFPNYCMYTIGVFAVILIISFIYAYITKKPDAKTINVEGPGGIILIVSFILLLISSIGCGYYYDWSKRSWIYSYGTTEQKTALAVADATAAIRNSMIR